jgi:hypothetical integral membrane protein (TIGR02206 family)
MTHLQLGFIAGTFLVPVLLWLGVRLWCAGPPRKSSAGIERIIAWALAAVLLVSYAVALYIKRTVGGLAGIDDVLPMHLCDWAAFATLIALLGRGQASFEVAYCWGLAGTFQALLTPAVAVDGGLLIWCFMIIHSVIPASVVWLLIGPKMRPSARSWRRVALWSQVYFLSTIITNQLTGANYGFLARRPDKPTLLDQFPDPWWLYVLSINAFALVLFALMLAPWRVAKRLH